MKHLYALQEIAERLGTREHVILRYCEIGWLEPHDPIEKQFDDEDLARARLISELIDDFGVNDEAIPIILQLLDQIHGLRREIRLKFFDDSNSGTP